MSNRSHFAAFFLFALVGAVTAVLYFTLFALLLDRAGLDYRIAVTASYASAVAFHFAANRVLTFRRGTGPVRAQIVRYLALAAINYAVTFVTVDASVRLLGVDPKVGAAIAILLTFVSGYIVSRYWIFRVR